MTNIETGVDRLVQLVKDRKRISIADSAKKLGVSKIVLQEWADFLQEEKIIDIDYKLTTTWLIEKKFTEEDIKDKKSALQNLKDNFIRKVETAIQGIDNDSDGLKKIKGEFEKIKKEVGKELELVQGQVNELESFENLKKNIDHEIITQQVEFKNHMKKIHEDLLEEEKKYQNLVGSIGKEKDFVKHEEEEVKILMGDEDKLNFKLKQIKDIIETTHKKIHDNNEKIEFEKDHIKSLESLTNKLEQTVIKKRKSIDPLLIKSKESEQKIVEIQDKLLEKVLQRKAIISKAATQGKSSIESFKAFFDKKAQIDELLMKIEEDRINLKTELSDLIKKAKMLEIVSNTKETDKNIIELKRAMETVEDKKEYFKNEVNNLLNIVQK